MSLITVFYGLCCIAATLLSTNAFVSTCSKHSPSKVLLQAEPTKNPVETRRSAMFLIGATFGTVALGNPDRAEARYSSYTHREQDWQERQEKGEVNYKSARDLRVELKEIAPMNTESSKIFCPNGPSAAVSPLMENKCGDRLAIPSVYGRTQDVVGNSIPGFATSYRSPDLGNSVGFPSYK